jgi:nucleotide-binding universal stress UspA family protein
MPSRELDANSNQDNPGALVMAYRTILVSLNDVPNANMLVSASTKLAALHDAHLIACYVIPAPTVYAEVGIFPAATFDDPRTKYFKSNLDALKAGFEDALRKNGARGDWRTIQSSYMDLAPDITRNGSRSDLIIVNRPSGEEISEVESDLVEGIIMGSGRPVLVMPPKKDWKQPAAAIVGFNGTREAVRAVFDSIPLLKSVRNVYVTWVNPYKERDRAGEIPCAEVAVALVRHGINATADSIAGADADAGEVLLQKANDVGAGLLVMGAYAHSRLREYVFGGATRHVLQKATIPVLMSR